MSAYRIASRAHARRAHKRRWLAPNRGHRAMLWRYAISWFTPHGKIKSQVIAARMMCMLDDVAYDAPPPRRDVCADARQFDLMLRYAWVPVRVDA